MEKGLNPLDLPYRFKLEDESLWKEFLKEHGYVIVSGAISEQEAKQALKGMKETLCKFAPNLHMTDEQS